MLPRVRVVRDASVDKLEGTVPTKELPVNLSIPKALIAPGPNMSGMVPVSLQPSKKRANRFVIALHCEGMVPVTGAPENVKEPSEVRRERAPGRVPDTDVPSKYTPLRLVISPTSEGTVPPRFALPFT